MEPLAGIQQKLDEQSAGILALSDDGDSKDRRIASVESLNPVDVVMVNSRTPSLIGRFRSDAQSVIVMLDASLGSLTLMVPSALASKNTIFTYKKIDGSANTITLKAFFGEYILDSSKVIEYVISSAAPANMVSDRIGGYLVI